MFGTVLAQQGSSIELEQNFRLGQQQQPEWILYEQYYFECVVDNSDGFGRLPRLREIHVVLPDEPPPPSQLLQSCHEGQAPDRHLHGQYAVRLIQSQRWRAAAL